MPQPNEKNATRQIIKSFLAQNGVTLKEVVEKMNERHPDDPTTPQNITNKLARGTIKFSEVMEIADILDYSVGFIPKHGKYYAPENNLRQLEMVVTIPSPNFGETIISGIDAQKAADYIKENIGDASKAMEILLHNDVRSRFDVQISVTNRN